ncbi:hypothetical protein IscW_ISCW018258 [Ixodes scapularis]|uniref:Uncharacterized protein n=1 Tax=Ixodes scapularis TaxID=6945 RepID=B7PHR5_IXOSC|nr:hypothetical protein IscW_ISCW018258 [Ixodes scapularis]|eukprot:XP_002403385.1 hypothetical protein IscW_ISCW018258 [Ixodes scapularis]
MPISKRSFHSVDGRATGSVFSTTVPAASVRVCVGRTGAGLTPRDNCAREEDDAYA